jgi:single-strand DNA-binding protein
MDMANITITGRLGADPELKDHNGTTFSTFSVACNIGGKDEAATWFRVTVFGKQGAACNKYLRKGSEVVIAGDLKVRVYEKNDQKNTSLDVRANRVKFTSQKVAQAETEEIPF